MRPLIASLPKSNTRSTGIYLNWFETRVQRTSWLQLAILAPKLDVLEEDGTPETDLLSQPVALTTTIVGWVSDCTHFEEVHMEWL